MARAKTQAQCVEKDLGEEMSKKEERTRPRKVPKRFDSSQTTATIFSVDSIRLQHFYSAIDKMLAELDKRFPEELKDFAYLQPKHFDKPEADSAIRRLCLKYRALVSPTAVTERRLFRHAEGLREMTLAEICTKVPSHYVDLKTLYRIFLTISLPVTTASVERGFSKLKLIENRLRSTQVGDRLEALMFAAVEKDVANVINIPDLVSKFADRCDRRLQLK